jgi:hypothetical protein
MKKLDRIYTNVKEEKSLDEELVKLVSTSKKLMYLSMKKAKYDGMASIINALLFPSDNLKSMSMEDRVKYLYAFTERRKAELDRLESK